MSGGASTTIHQSLLRRPLFLGVSFEAVAGEGLLLVVAYAVFGLGLQMGVFLLLTLTPAHTLLRRLTAADPDAFALIMESFKYPRHRPSHGLCFPSLAVSPRGSLPRS